MRLNRTLGSVGPILAILLALSACSADVNVEAGATGVGDPAGSSSVETTEGSEVATTGEPPASERDETHEEGSQAQAARYETYDEWKGHELAPLVPSPEDLGPGWNNFGVQLLPEAPLFDPSDEEEGDSCGLTEPLLVRNGFIAEHGYGESPDDALVLVSRGTTDQLRAIYDGLRILFECPAQNDPAGNVFRPKPAPELPGVIESIRYATDDDLGQHLEGILLRRADFVYLLGVFEQEGAEPIDLDVLVTRLITEYDAQNP